MGQPDWLKTHFAKRNVEFWDARAKGMLNVTDRVMSILGYVSDRIDLGGGIFGNMEEDLKKQFSNPIPEYKDYAKAAVTLFAEHFPDKKPELLVEPGSALAGDSMKFVGRVESIKNVRGKQFVTMLGSQKNISMSGVNPVSYTHLDVYKRQRMGIAVVVLLISKKCGSFERVNYIILIE